MKFILIAVLVGGYNNSTPAISMQEFDSKQSCNHAAQVLIESVTNAKSSVPRTIKGVNQKPVHFQSAPVCVPK